MRRVFVYVYFDIEVGFIRLPRLMKVDNNNKRKNITFYESKSKT